MPDNHLRVIVCAFLFVNCPPLYLLVTPNCCRREHHQESYKTLLPSSGRAVRQSIFAIHSVQARFVFRRETPPKKTIALATPLIWHLL